MFRALHIWLTLAMAVTANAEIQSDYQARVAQGDFQGALAVLQLVPADSPSFPWAIHEAAKVAYRAERWSEFFALSYYARATFAPGPLREELTLLETLGLLRHCQFQRAAAVFAQIDAKQIPASYHVPMKNVASWLELFQAATIESPAKDATSRPSAVFQDRPYWRVRFDREQMKRVDPWRMRREITPACQGRGK